MYLLDTNVISEMRKLKSGRADPNVQHWADSVSTSQLYVSVITLLELKVGVLQLMRKDPIQGRILNKWLVDQVFVLFADRTLVVDTEIALRCAELHVPITASRYDSLIAATALVHNMTVVTRNTADFASTGVSVLNPCQA